MNPTDIAVVAIILGLAIAWAYPLLKPYLPSLPSQAKSIIPQTGIDPIYHLLQAQEAFIRLGDKASAEATAAILTSLAKGQQ